MVSAQERNLKTVQRAVGFPNFECSLSCCRRKTKWDSMTLQTLFCGIMETVPKHWGQSWVRELENSPRPDTLHSAEKRLKAKVTCLIINFVYVIVKSLQQVMKITGIIVIAGLRWMEFTPRINLSAANHSSDTSDLSGCPLKLTSNIEQSLLKTQLYGVGVPSSTTKDCQKPQKIREKHGTNFPLQASERARSC